MGPIGRSATGDYSVGSTGFSLKAHGDASILDTIDWTGLMKMGDISE